MWKDSIRKATFRGVPFGVTKGDKEAGRRGILHEFPARDFPYAEDLGASPQKFTLTAFVLGSDYMDKRDALEKALQEEGSGTLVHPWYGEIEVDQFAPYKVSHSASDGGMAVFTLSFVQSKEPSSPSPAVNQNLRAAEKAQKAGDIACTAFDSTLKVIGQSAHVVSQTVEAVTKAVERVQAILGGDICAISSLISDITGYNLTPALMTGQNLWNIFSNLGKSSGKSKADLSNAWAQVAGTYVPVAISPQAGSSRTQIAKNQVAVNEFTRQIAIIEASKALATSAPTSKKEAQNIRYEYIDSLEALITGTDVQTPEILPPAPLPDALFTALIELQAVTLNSLAQQAGTAPEVVAFTPKAILPSLVLSYTLTGNIALEQDLISRNKISHPVFMPIESLEVLKYE